MSMNLTLRNETYHTFVEKHIKNPYFNMLNISEFKTDQIGQYVWQNPEWADLIFRRISRIYSRIEASIFPHDSAGQVIITELIKRGVQLF